MGTLRISRNNLSGLFRADFISRRAEVPQKSPESLTHIGSEWRASNLVDRVRSSSNKKKKEETCARARCCEDSRARPPQTGLPSLPLEGALGVSCLVPVRKV